MLELARQQGTDGHGGVLPALPPAVLRTFERVALLGSTFSTDELLAVSGVDEDESYHHLEVALAGLVIERGDGGYRFRHALVRESLVNQLTPATEASAHRVVAEQLARLGAPPGRVAHHYLAAGQPSRAVPFVTRAVETAGALGAYRDALTLVDAVRAHADADQLPALLARRGDLLMALGDPAAVAAYREAVACDHRHRAPAGSRPARARLEPGRGPGRRSQCPRRTRSSRATPPTRRSCSRRGTWPTSAATSTPPGTSPARPATGCGHGTTRGRSSTWSCCRG